MTDMSTIRCPHCGETIPKKPLCDNCTQPTTELIALVQIRDQLREINRKLA